MDIVVRLEKSEYDLLRNDTREFIGKPGWHFHTVRKKPKKLRSGDMKKNNEVGPDKIYFLYSGEIVGYGDVYAVIKIDHEFNIEFVGSIFQQLGKYLVTWKKQYWYDEPFEYHKKIKPQGWRYFDCREWLKSRPELKG